MASYFFTCDKKTNEKRYYKMDAYGDGRLGKELETSEVINLLFDLDLLRILDADETKDNIAKITFENNMTLFFDDPNVFAFQDGLNEYYLHKLLDKINLFLDTCRKHDIEDYKASLPDGVKPRINRKNPIKKIAKGVVSATLLLTMATSVFTLLNSGEINTLDHVEAVAPEISATSLEYKQESDAVLLENEVDDDLDFPLIEILDEEPVEDNTMSNNDSKDGLDIEFDWEDITSTIYADGKSKLEITKESCTSYLEPLIERYGLPHDVTYALVATEQGEFDMRTNAGGACGPMQIQVSAFHGEHIRAAIYKDGKRTGEYDDFYVADEQFLDDPALAGKKVLVIQNLEDNFIIGTAYFRECIDKYKNLFIAVDAYNKGLYAFGMAASADTVNYYRGHPEDFGWTPIIPAYFGQDYGCPTYIWEVLGSLEVDENNSAKIEFYYEDELVTYNLSNTRYLENNVTYTDGVER